MIKNLNSSEISIVSGGGIVSTILGAVGGACTFGGGYLMAHAGFTTPTTSTDSSKAAVAELGTSPGPTAAPATGCLSDCKTAMMITGICITALGGSLSVAAAAVNQY